MFSSPHHGHECHGNFELLMILFELFFFHGGMTVHHTSLLTFINHELRAQA